MSAMNKKVVVSTVLALSLLQAGLAGVAFYARQMSEDGIVAEQQRLDALEQRIELLAEQPTVEQPRVAAPRWQLLDGPDVVSTLQTMQRLGDQAGISFDEQRAIRSSEPGKQAFSIVGRGTPTNVCRFVAAIEASERLMIVETGRILPASDTEIAFELGLATYHGGGQ